MTALSPCPDHGGAQPPRVPHIDFRDCGGLAALVVDGEVVAHAGAHEAGQLATGLAAWAIRQNEENEGEWTAWQVA